MNKALASKRKTALIQNPGAGLGEITPFEKVYKDGFYEVDCVKDSLREFGDKFGNGKQSYNMGNTANVSIIHYTETVPKEDQEEMSHEVCFNFCRTVPDMLFFGIHNGRDCYCEPYFDAMESDSSECDSTCEGSPTQMCGGKVKSSIFGMHSCMNKFEKMSDISDKVEDVFSDLTGKIDDLEDVERRLQGLSSFVQDIAGQFGDPAASNLMQESKVFAGEIEKFIKDEVKVVRAMMEAKGDAKALKGKDLTKFENAAKADAAIKDMEESLAAGEDSAKAAEKLLKLASPQNEDAKGRSKQYYGLMYFAGDKSLADAPTTCNGDMVNKPMALLSEDECAAACDDAFQSCVAYSYYPGQVCVMFSYLKTATVYEGCKSSKSDLKQVGFLQKQQESRPDMTLTCKLKLSSYEGTNISPESDRAKAGKCPNCLKELTKRTKCPLPM